MINIDVVCPLYNAENLIDNLIKNILLQKKVNIGKIIFCVTESGDSTIEKLKIYNNLVEFFAIAKEDFSHSGVRYELIKRCSSDIVIMITQDVIIFDEFSFFELAKSIDDVDAFAFGKQISKYRGIEKYIREINYPNFDYTMTKKDIPKYQLKTFFSSDAFSAYNREVFIKLNGYDGKKMMMNEDMYYAYKIIMNGYALRYVSSAVVEHSHKFKLKTLYKRYYDTGVFFKENPFLKGFKSNEVGIKLALKLFLKILKNFDFYSLLIFIPNMITRYLGKRAGENS